MHDNNNEHQGHRAASPRCRKMVWLLRVCSRQNPDGTTAKAARRSTALAKREAAPLRRRWRCRRAPGGQDIL